MKLQHNPDLSRYELFVDDRLATVAEYRLQDDTATFHHTETDPAFRGRGLAAMLVRWALDDARKRGRRVIPSCWFVADFVRQHPEYRDLLAA